MADSEQERFDRELAWLGAALLLLARGQVPLGGHAARGAGRIEGLEGTIRSRDLTDPEHLLAMALADERDACHLKDGDPAWPIPVAGNLGEFPGKSLAFPDRHRVEFLLAPDETQGGTFLVNDPVESLLSGYDRAPRGGLAAAELPATSLRGALRSGAERILRTIAGPSSASIACDPSGSPCRKPGPASSAGRGEPRAEPPIESWCCLACQVFGNTDFASRLLIDVRREAGTSHRVPFDHLAIDRFTGGSARPAQVRRDGRAAGASSG